jgi:hypothetical protein
LIDENDTVLVEAGLSPHIEDTFEMAVALLMGLRGNSLPDHIYSRKKFDDMNGFIKTDYAQGADWANSIFFSGEKGLCTIPGPRVNWRLSTVNISGNASKNVSVKLKGHLQFLKWVKEYFHYLVEKNPEKYKQILSACDVNLDAVLRKHYKTLSPASIKDILLYYKYPGQSSGKVIRQALRLYKYYFAVPIILKIKNGLRLPGKAKQ